MAVQIIKKEIIEEIYICDLCNKETIYEYAVKTYKEKLYCRDCKNKKQKEITDNCSHEDVEIKLLNRYNGQIKIICKEEWCQFTSKMGTGTINKNKVILNEIIRLWKKSNNA